MATPYQGEVQSPVATSTYRYSNLAAENIQRQSQSNDVPVDVFIRGSLMDRGIRAVEMADSGKVERSKHFKGRFRRWPGLLLLVLLAAAAVFLVVHYGIMTHESSQDHAAEYDARKFNATKIADGRKDIQNDLTDDGVVGNPVHYPKRACELPNYLSKNGQIVAVSTNGTEVPLKIKGINWFGMETGQAIPYGLWGNADNGTTAYQIASFLARNKFNAVRLPLMATWILENKVPNTALLNKRENQAINATNYMTLLQSTVKALQYRDIGILLSMHTLTYKDNGMLWYNDAVSEENFLEAIDILTKNLCSNDYWNIMGIDLKNEPYKGTWGDGGPTDFHAGAQRIANRMLKGCPKWMGFVEGVNAQHTIVIDGEEFGYYDWYGGGLHGAKKLGMEFDIPNKVVWAPHYYTPAVYPQYYLYGGGTVAEDKSIQDYVELDDDTLRHRIKVTMDDMFGFLASETGPALLLGEFGGLYSHDKHPKKTTQRCTDFTIEIITKPGWAGGFAWSLNPESGYLYNPVDTYGGNNEFTEGLLTTDWLGVEKPFLDGMAAMDNMENLRPFPCFAQPRKQLRS